MIELYKYCFWYCVVHKYTFLNVGGFFYFINSIEIILLSIYKIFEIQPNYYFLKNKIGMNWIRNYKDDAITLRITALS